jgi:hypothetical protein
VDAGEYGCTSIRLRAQGSNSRPAAAFTVRQALATGAPTITELDDANGFNDPAKISVGGLGTPTYGAAPCPPP